METEVVGKLSPGAVVVVVGGACREVGWWVAIRARERVGHGRGAARLRVLRTDGLPQAAAVAEGVLCEEWPLSQDEVDADGKVQLEGKEEAEEAEAAAEEVVLFDSWSYLCGRCGLVRSVQAVERARRRRRRRKVPGRSRHDTEGGEHNDDHADVEREVGGVILVLIVDPRVITEAACKRVQRMATIVVRTTFVPRAPPDAAGRAGTSVAGARDRVRVDIVRKGSGGTGRIVGAKDEMDLESVRHGRAHTRRVVRRSCGVVVGEPTAASSSKGVVLLDPDDPEFMSKDQRGFAEDEPDEDDLIDAGLTSDPGQDYDDIDDDLDL